MDFIPSRFLDAHRAVMRQPSDHACPSVSVIPREQIDERYFESPYYICPNDKVGQDAFAVIREAMRGKGMVALGRIVLAKRERVIALETSHTETVLPGWGGRTR